MVTPLGSDSLGQWLFWVMTSLGGVWLGWWLPRQWLARAVTYLGGDSIGLWLCRGVTYLDGHSLGHWVVTSLFEARICASRIFNTHCILLGGHLPVTVKREILLALLTVNEKSDCTWKITYMQIDLYCHLNRSDAQVGFNVRYWLHCQSFLHRCDSMWGTDYIAQVWFNVRYWLHYQSFLLELKSF